MKPSEHLYAAADYIAENGHHKGAATGPDGSACAMGAINRAKGSSEFDEVSGSRQQAGDAVNDYALAHFDVVPADRHPGWLVPMAQYNDDPHTSAEDVILTMKTVAARLEAEGR